MASLSDLINVLQPLDGRDKPTLYNAARVLREEDLLPRGQRGGSAPQIDFSHGTNVLLGVIGTTHVKNAAERCRLLNSLLHIDSPFSGDEKGVFVRQRRFGSTLTGLLSSLPKVIDQIESLLIKSRYKEGCGGLSEDLRNCALGYGPLVLRVIVRDGSARIELTDNQLRHIWREDFASDPTEAFHIKINNRRTRDRQVTIEFGLRTLVETFLCLAPPVQAEGLAKKLSWNEFGG